MRVAALTLVFMRLASPADVRIDSAHLGAFFGPPTKQHQSPHEEVFTVRPHVCMKVTYGPGDQVCSLAIPAGTDGDRQAQSVLDQVVPPEMRGKELNRLLVMTGLPEILTTYNENVVITPPPLEQRASHPYSSKTPHADGPPTKILSSGTHKAAPEAI